MATLLPPAVLLPPTLEALTAPGAAGPGLAEAGSALLLPPGLEALEAPGADGPGLVEAGSAVNCPDMDAAPPVALLLPPPAALLLTPALETLAPGAEGPGLVEAGGAEDFPAAGDARGAAAATSSATTRALLISEDTPAGPRGCCSWIGARALGRATADGRRAEGGAALLVDGALEEGAALPGFEDALRGASDLAAFASSFFGSSPGLRGGSVREVPLWGLGNLLEAGMLRTGTGPRAAAASLPICGGDLISDFALPLGFFVESFLVDDGVDLSSAAAVGLVSPGARLVVGRFDGLEPGARDAPVDSVLGMAVLCNNFAVVYRCGFIGLLTYVFLAAAYLLSY